MLQTFSLKAQKKMFLFCLLLTASSPEGTGRGNIDYLFHNMAAWSNAPHLLRAIQSGQSKPSADGGHYWVQSFHNGHHSLPLAPDTSTVLLSTPKNSSLGPFPGHLYHGSFYSLGPQNGKTNWSSWTPDKTIGHTVHSVLASCCWLLLPPRVLSRGQVEKNGM